MNRTDILVAVDVTGALSSSSLLGNVYLIDTNKYLGSWQEGQSQLNTVCQDGQQLTWSVASVDPGNSVSIVSFSGAMVSSKVCAPQTTPLEGSGIWSGQVEAQGSFASYPYTLTLALGAQQLSFDAFLKVV